MWLYVGATRSATAHRSEEGRTLSGTVWGGITTTPCITKTARITSTILHAVFNFSFSMIASDGVWFTIVYAMLVLCIMAPTSEIIESGLTVAQLLKGFIDDENTNFIQHYLSLTAANTVVHSILPLGESAAETSAETSAEEARRALKHLSACENPSRKSCCRFSPSFSFSLSSD